MDNSKLYSFLYQNLRKYQLYKLCRALGLSISGTKGEIIERIINSGENTDHILDLVESELGTSFKQEMLSKLDLVEDSLIAKKLYDQIIKMDDDQIAILQALRYLHASYFEDLHLKDVKRKLKTLDLEKSQDDILNTLKIAGFFFFDDLSPKEMLKGLTIAQIKDILRKFDLRIRGRKDELIEHVLENVHETQIKEEYSKLHGDPIRVEIPNNIEAALDLLFDVDPDRLVDRLVDLTVNRLTRNRYHAEPIEIELKLELFHWHITAYILEAPDSDQKSLLVPVVEVDLKKGDIEALKKELHDPIDAAKILIIPQSKPLVEYALDLPSQIENIVVYFVPNLSKGLIATKVGSITNEATIAVERVALDYFGFHFGTSSEIDDAFNRGLSVEILTRLQELKNGLSDLKFELKNRQQKIIEKISLNFEEYARNERQQKEIHEYFKDILRQLKDLRQKREILKLSGQFEELGALPEHILKLEEQLDTIRNKMRIGQEILESQLDQISNDVVEILNQQKITDEFLKEKLKGNWEKLKDAWRTDKKQFSKDALKLLGPQFLKLIDLRF